MNRFHWTSTFFYVVFIGVMIGATYIAFSRKSGNTHIDMAKVHLLRHKLTEKQE